MASSARRPRVAKSTPPAMASPGSAPTPMVSRRIRPLESTSSVASRLISVVAFYGPKTGRLRELLTGVQAVIAEQVGGDFRPYTLDQVHATLIALDGVREGGTIVNEYLLEHAGERREMDLPRVMDILARRFAAPLRVRIGGFRPG